MFRIGFRFIIVFMTLLAVDIWAQTALIKAPKVFPDMKEEVDFIKFRINGQQFGERDTVIRIRLQKEGWDTCIAMTSRDTIMFLAKFKDKGYYEIEQGCCCAEFTMHALSNSRHGTLRFKNLAPKPLGLQIGIFNVDTVKAGGTSTILPRDSPMCSPKPFDITLVKPAYFADKYYQSGSPKYNEMREKEQKKLILGKTWILFLHGEKVELLYNEKKRKLDLKLLGYLTDEEYKVWWNGGF